MKKGKILFVVSNASTIGPKQRKTGNFLSEISHPFHVFRNERFWVDFASIQGGEPTLDAIDTENDMYNKEFMDGEGYKIFSGSYRIDEIDASDYEAVFFPGGLAVMVDLPYDKNVQKTIASIYSNGGVISSVCHGAVSLLNVVLPDGSFLVKNKRLTSFSSNEELEYGVNDVDFMLDVTLSKRGANYSCAEKWKSHVVIDGKLVTGQNPASALDVANEVVKLLKREAPLL